MREILSRGWWKSHVSVKHIVIIFYYKTFNVLKVLMFSLSHVFGCDLMPIHPEILIVLGNIWIFITELQRETIPKQNIDR